MSNRPCAVWNWLYPLAAGVTTLSSHIATEFRVVARRRRVQQSWGANAMKRVAAGDHLPTPWFFESQNAQTIEPTITWAAATAFPFQVSSGI